MRERLIAYVDLLFAGNPEAGDIKQEILQNTLDKYDDLVAGGKTPEAAYSLAISGIGDLSELLKGNATAAEYGPAVRHESEEEKNRKKLMRSLSVGLYIACPIPLFLVGGSGGLSLLLVMVAISTVLRIFAGKEKQGAQGSAYAQSQMSPQAELKKSIGSAIDTVGLCGYFIVSFLTGAWHLTWLIFPLTGAVKGLANAIMDLKEAE